MSARAENPDRIHFTSPAEAVAWTTFVAAVVSAATDTTRDALVIADSLLYAYRERARGSLPPPTDAPGRGR